MTHAAVVFNPLSAPVQEIQDALPSNETKAGWDATRWYRTDAGDSGIAAALSAVDEGAAVIIVAGGDGTVRAVAEAVHGTGVAVALVPAGTGNLLARNLGVPRGDVARCVAAAFSDRTRDIDVGVADLQGDQETARRTHVFMVMAGIGLDAEMAVNTSILAKKRLGWLAYVTPIARSVVLNRLFHVRFRIDGGHVRSSRAHTIIVGNCGTLTGNMLLIPAAVVDDGLLDVVMMRPGRRVGWAQIGTRLTLQSITRRSPWSRRMLDRAPAIRSLAYAQGARFDAHFDAPHEIELDGDSFGGVLRARITVRPGALRVCLVSD